VIREIGKFTAMNAGDIQVLDAHHWYPIDWNNPVHAFFRREMLAKQFMPSERYSRLLFPRSSLVTYWTHSW
jgi:hypothetical protein